MTEAYSKFTLALSSLSSASMINAKEKAADVLSSVDDVFKAQMKINFELAKVHQRIAEKIDKLESGQQITPGAEPVEPVAALLIDVIDLLGRVSPSSDQTRHRIDALSKRALQAVAAVQAVKNDAVAEYQHPEMS